MQDKKSATANLLLVFTSNKVPDIFQTDGERFRIIHQLPLLWRIKIIEKIYSKWLKVQAIVRDKNICHKNTIYKVCVVKYFVWIWIWVIGSEPRMEDSRLFFSIALLPIFDYLVYWLETTWWVNGVPNWKFAIKFILSNNNLEI